MPPTEHQRWARAPLYLAWKRPGLPTEWTRVLELNPEAMNPEPMPGYVWMALVQPLIARRMPGRHRPNEGALPTSRSVPARPGQHV
jgi:hypothetical protein